MIAVGRNGDDNRAHRNQPSGDDGQAGDPGTRITVELILRKLAEGETESELLEDYPHLRPEDICAAIAYSSPH